MSFALFLGKNLHLSIDEFHITWWPWRPMQLDGHLDWLRFDTLNLKKSLSIPNASACIIVQKSTGIKMESIKVAIQLHGFPWSPRYVKRVYWRRILHFSLPNSCTLVSPLLNGAEFTLSIAKNVALFETVPDSSFCFCQMAWQGIEAP